MKNIVNELKKIYPNASFVVFSTEPLVVYHNSEELLDDKELIRNFINAYKVVYGMKGLEKAAIAYDFAEESEELSCCTESYESVFQFSKSFETVSRIISNKLNFTPSLRIGLSKG